MSKLRANIGTAVFSISKWLGLNESPDSDSNLKQGEAAAMRNFRVTDGGVLRRRPGSKTVAGLMSDYTYTAGESQLLFTDKGSTGHAFVSAISLDSVGMIHAAGESYVVAANTAENYTGWYYQDGDNWHCFDSITQIPGKKYEGIHSFSYRDFSAETPLWAYVFSEIPRMGLMGWETDQALLMNIAAAETDIEGKYIILNSENAPALIRGGEAPDYDAFGFNDAGKYCRITGSRFVADSGGWQLTLHVDIFDADSYEWYFSPVIVNPNKWTDSAVRGLWSGYVGSEEYIVAACNGFLWSLSENEGVWQKEAIGPVNTGSRVCLFGFGGKLYCLDDMDYWRWDGARLERVNGYVPIIGTGSAPSGETTLLERVNLLTPQRRQQFSGDGTSLEYKLAEKNLAMVYKVTVDGDTEISAYTADPLEGTVVFTEAPAEGVNNVEIWYTASEDYRQRVVSMGYAEFYNGATDNRVFLYGDGSNTCLYSDIEYGSGEASAEYFPDLNEIAVGDANTPLTAMIRQYNRLMAFKRGGGAWSIYYSETVLPDGNITAGFYCSGVNRDIGCDGMGQSVLVENYPRTMDGRSIYEWRSASGGYVTNDQRNAHRISQKVEKSLGRFDPEKTKLFFDHIKHEFYCICGSTAVIQNTENDTWYVYTEFPAAELIVYKDELYYGTSEGALRKVSDDYVNDDGENIDALWESGSMNFGMDYVYKYSPEIWVGLKQEQGALIWLGINTDMGDEAYEFVSTMDLRDIPTTVRRRLKARRFTHYKLRLFLDAANARATVSSVDIHVKYNKNVN